MFGRQITLFRLLGFNINVDASWLILVAIIVWSLAQGVFPAILEGQSPGTYWTMALVGTVFFFASLVLHELSHSLVARRFDMPIRGITLFIFGGVAQLGGEPPHARAEFLVAIAGPIMSGVLAALFYGAGVLADGAGASPALVVLLTHLGLLNLVLAVFNLLPAFPLDGGRVFRAILWHWKGDLRWATHIATRGGEILAYLLIALGVLSLFTGNLIGGLWWIFIGFFLKSAASGSYAQVAGKDALSHQPVSSIMAQPVIAVPAQTTIRDFLDDYLYRYHHDLFPVTEDGRLAGYVTTRDLAGVAKENWDAATVSVIATPLAAEAVINARAPAIAALERMQETGRSRLMVVEGDKLVGMVTLKDLLHMLNLKMRLDDI